MRWIRALPLKRQLTLVIVATCATVLLLACAILATYELHDFRQALVRDSTIMADILGGNTQAALAFDDPDAARSILRGLHADPQVVAVRVYDRAGRPFADFVRSDGAAWLPQRAEPAGARFADGALAIVRPIILDGKAIGSIRLQVALHGMYTRIGLFAGISGLVLAGSLILALAISNQLQGLITRPILELAATARSIATNKDYTVRAPVNGRGNELGVLGEAFNHMLTQIHGQLARVDLLNRIARAIGEHQDLASLFQVVVRSLEDDLPIDFCCVFLHDPTAGTLTVASVGAKSATLAAELALPVQAVIGIDQNGLARCVRGELVHEPDTGDARFPFSQRLAQSGLRALVIAPLLVENQVFGVILAARRRPGDFTSGECEFLRQLSEQVALAAHQAQLHGALQQAYDDLRQTQQAVMQQERLRVLGQMASGIAHDINNAITPVALYSELLLTREPGLSALARHRLEIIGRAIGDVAHTVARLREFYRQQEAPISLAPVELNQLVPQILDLTRARWSDMPQQRGRVITTRMELAAELPTIHGVASEVREALINLVFNAVDAMPEGGTLVLRTRLADGDSLPADGLRPRRVLVEVVDDGVGMDEETRRRCLEPFFTTKGERGTGLGLAMVYGVAQRHGAQIEIASAHGSGTAVRLIFPIPTDPATAGRPAPAPEQPPPMRILVVDDDPLLLTSLCDALRSDGHTVVAAGQGQVGIDAFRNAQQRGEPFDVVLTDLGMPYVDGRKVASSVKGGSPETPVILLTGWGQRLVAEGDVPPHVDCVLSKPPSLRALRTALSQHSRR